MHVSFAQNTEYGNMGQNGVTGQNGTLPWRADVLCCHMPYRGSPFSSIIMGQINNNIGGGRKFYQIDTDTYHRYQIDTK